MPDCEVTSWQPCLLLRSAVSCYQVSRSMRKYMNKNQIVLYKNGN